jgi:hypothetical protein
MVGATMSFAFSGGTARVRTTSHGSVLGAQEQRSGIVPTALVVD